MQRRGWHQQFKRRPAADRTCDGFVFASVGEMQRWIFLREWEKRGYISGLKRQVRYQFILPDGTEIRYPGTRHNHKGVLATYTSDFEYTLTEKHAPSSGSNFAKEGHRVIEEYKGFDDGTGRLRRAVFEAIYKIKIRVVKKPTEAL